MKKNSTKGKGEKQDLKQEQKLWKGPITIGMDVGDKTSRYCILDGDGEQMGKAAWARRKRR